MTAARRLATLVMIGAVTVVGACREDDNPSIEEPTVSSTSTAPAAATPCEKLQQGLERLRQTLGVPDGIDELKQMLADGLDEVEAAVRDAGDLTGEAAGPVRDSLRQAAGNARRAVAAVGDGDFGNAREELGKMREDVGDAWDQLGKACGRS